ncbi:branched-chain amino acid transport [Ancylobacter novellus DSM 506]|uniref:Branched-chain amino acid transport n=1 Tax=Ancylobacter novellus (strain ATCC 8093 / DSM 506 / JCM 20403 / CCM 1077 / IAM 12100 / NBRC 12443 / NCIMB 10456) TaxID=639283 RepID=D7A9N2_ANCN5|nr:AzlD domain-containing protein [Ancylobacter novellus]ADH88808.1 branched-chain amino acid transport [Ancylobacter novellus DSM 506]
MNFYSTELGAMLVVVLVGFLPNELWRVLGVLFGRRIDENSVWMQWVRAVATALLAAVVARLLLVPSGALVTLPLWLRIGAVASGIAGFLLLRRSVLAGVLTAEAVLILGGWWLGV